MDIKKTVKELVDKYKTFDPFEIADQMGILVQKHPPGRIGGYYMIYSGIKCICINSDIDDSKLENTIMAHELGHAILHADTEFMFFKGTLFSESKYEKQANCFAAELLIPDSIIYDNPDLKKSQLAVLTGYTEKLLDYKRL